MKMTKRNIERVIYLLEERRDRTVIDLVWNARSIRWLRSNPFNDNVPFQIEVRERRKNNLETELDFSSILVTLAEAIKENR